VLHSSSSDTHCLGQCLSELLRRGLIVAEGGTVMTVKVSETATLTSVTSS
jgi:hypothetical protein